MRQGGGAMEWWKAPNWEGPERNALRDERRREHWWERQEDERYRLCLLYTSDAADEL